jgi:hypothetical protein
VKAMLIPIAKAKEFEKFGFKKCKGVYGKHDCYYLCIAKGIKMLYVSDAYLALMIGGIMTQEYINTLIADTETTELTLILSTS